jgi:hypothetical protein
MSTGLMTALDEQMRRYRLSPSESAREAIQCAIRRADSERRPYSVWQSIRTGRFFAWPAGLGGKPPQARYLCPVNPATNGPLKPRKSDA